MGARGRVQVALEIEQAEGTIRGRLAVEGAPGNRFFGWLELLDLLGRAADGRPFEPDADHPTERGQGY